MSEKVESATLLQKNVIAEKAARNFAILRHFVKGKLRFSVQPLVKGEIKLLRRTIYKRTLCTDFAPISKFQLH